VLARFLPSIADLSSSLFFVQIQTAQGEVVITNDGATILKHMAVLHPAARMVSLSLRSFSLINLVQKERVEVIFLFLLR